MKRALPFLVIVILLASASWGMQEQRPDRDAAPPPPERSRFAYVDVFLDPADIPLAAYQVELTASATTKIISLEGGDHAAFKSPPFYDAAAIHHNRIILAAYHTGEALPSQRIRIARVHVQTTGKFDPHARLIVAGSREAKSIPARVSVMEGEAQ